MAMTLDQLTSVPGDRAPIITILGEHGVGKTSLAATFPHPVVLRFEDGMEAIPADRRPMALPLIEETARAMEYLAMLLKEDHAYQTLIVDSITRAHTLFEAEVLADDPKRPRSLATAHGGYGAGFLAVAERHRVFTNACRLLNQRRSMSIIYVAHSTVEQMQPPDADEYTRYNVNIEKRSRPFYLDEPDLVAFLKIKTLFVATGNDRERQRAVTRGERIIVTYPTGAHVSKNRYGITADIEWPDATVNPLAPYIPFLSAPAPAPRRRRAA